MKLIQAIPFIVGMVLLGGVASEAQAQPCPWEKRRRCESVCYRKCSVSFINLCFRNCWVDCYPRCTLIP
jgi:hypothetical protein